MKLNGRKTNCFIVVVMAGNMAPTISAKRLKGKSGFVSTEFFFAVSFAVGLSSDFRISLVSLTEFVNFHHKIFDNL